METGERILLPEIWMEVLKFLPVKDLCNMSLVSREINELCSRPKLWRNAKIRKLKFRNGDVRKFFEINLTGLDAVLMGSAINKLEKVNISGSKLVGDQLNPMVEQFDFKFLKDLNLDYLDLSKLSLENTCKLFKSIKKISLKKANLTPEQLNSFWSDLAEPGEYGELRDINFHGNNFSSVCSAALTDGVTRLHSLDLSHTNIPTEAMCKVFQSISTREDNCLQNLVLVGNIMDDLDPEEITRAMTKLEKLDLSSSGLQPHH